MNNLARVPSLAPGHIWPHARHESLSRGDVQRAARYAFWLALSNIFTKLGLSSRSAATAYAYQHDLV